MRKLSVFNHISLDGYFVGENNDFSWAKPGSDDGEYAAFVAGNADGGGELLFGRITYELMASYWPTPMADKHLPAVAKAMNARPKRVFSRTLSDAHWNNTTLTRGDLISEIRELKQADGPPMVILGSGQIVTQLAAAGLIDEYQLMVDPVALGSGRSLFEGIGYKLWLKLVNSRPFNNGKVLLSYAPAQV